MGGRLGWRIEHMEHLREVGELHHNWGYSYAPSPPLVDLVVLDKVDTHGQHEKDGVHCMFGKSEDPAPNLLWLSGPPVTLLKDCGSNILAV